jgi:hypothetical protein
MVPSSIHPWRYWFLGNEPRMTCKWRRGEKMQDKNIPPSKCLLFKHPAPLCTGLGSENNLQTGQRWLMPIILAVQKAD